MENNQRPIVGVAGNKKLKPLILVSAIILVALIAGLISYILVHDDHNKQNLKSDIALAEKYNNQNKPIQALTELNLAQNNSPNSANEETILTNKTIAYSSLEEYSNAIKSAEQAYKLQPTSASWPLFIAQMAQANGNNTTSAEYYQKAITMLETVPSNKRTGTYEGELLETEAQLKVVESK